MKTKKICIAVALLGLLGMNAANATLYSFSTSFPSGTTTYNQTIYVPQFDPSSWGYIASITYTISATLSASGSAYNDPLLSDNTAESVYKTSLQTATITAKLASDNTTLLDTANLKAYPISSDTTVNPGTLFTFPGVNFSTNVNNTITDSSIIGLFQGSGSVGVKMKAVVVNNMQFDADLTISTSDTVGGYFTISYDVVPEPATWVSAGLLVGFVVVGSARKALRK